jgi:ribosomal protein L29
MKIDEIRGKTDGELEFELKNLEKELFGLRFKASTEHSANPSRISEAPWPASRPSCTSVRARSADRSRASP